jgi:hypothetical protein
MHFFIGQPGSRRFLFLRYQGLEQENFLILCVPDWEKLRLAVSTLMLKSFVMTGIFSVRKAYLFSLKKSYILAVS